MANKMIFCRYFSFIFALTGMAWTGAAGAQDRSGSEPSAQSRPQRIELHPYVEADQIVSWQFTPTDDVVTYTRLAAGVDASVRGRNNGGSVSLRYERNFAWDSQRSDSDTLTGIARGYATVVPRAVTFEAGALATRTRVDGSGASAVDPIVADGQSAQTFSVYAGPNLSTRVGDVALTGNYRIGYTRVDGPDIVTAGGNAAGLFDESVTHRAVVRAGTQPGAPLPVGLGLGAGLYQEDISNLDQRIRDAYVRADVTVPLTTTLSAVGGVGIEDVRVSSRDALRDNAGNFVIGPDGRYVTDKSQPRQIAYEADGLIWDVGVIWRPSRRTSLDAHFGHRYDSETFYGSFSWQPDRRSNLSVRVFDGIQGFGGRLSNALATLPTDFDVIRDPVTGDITGCVSAIDGSSCLDSLLGSVRSAAFRGRGVNASYSRKVGRLTAAVGAGYDRRRFIGAPGTVFEAADGVTDQSWFATAQLSGPVWRGKFALNTYANWFDAGVGGNDLTVLGGSASYTQTIRERLSARAAIALTMLDSDVDVVDVTAATALVGLRYDF